ncbi:MAG: phage major capsid protein [Acidimicrobiales bacterium]
MPQNLTEASGILKDFHLPMAREQLVNKTVALAEIEKNDDDVEATGEGAELVLSLHVRRNTAVGAREDGGTVPTPGNQKYVKQRVPLRTPLTARIRLSLQVMAAMATNRGAWERAATSETKRVVNDGRRDVNRQLHGTSDGTIATTAASAASTTVTLATATTAVAMRQFEVGMLLDISSAATPGNAAVAASREITSVNRTAKTFVITGAAVATSAGDRVERQGSGGSGATQKEATGLQTIIDSTGTLFGVDPTVYDSWSSFEDATGGAPSENLFEKAMDEIDINGAGESTGEFLVLTTHGVMRGYSNQLTTLKRMPSTLVLKGGFKALEISSGSGMGALAADRDTPTGVAYFIDRGHWWLAQWNEPEWLDDGAVLRQVPDKLQVEATLYWIAEQVVDSRNAHAKLTGLTES